MSKPVLSPGNIGDLRITKPLAIGFMNLVIYGESGVGKTVLAASASAVEEMSPVLILDSESGTLSLRNRYPDVDVIQIRNFNDYATIHNAFRTGELKYKTIILDSITETAKVGMDDIMFRAVEKAALNGETRDPDLPGIGEYGKSANQTRKMIRFFRNLDANVILVALDQVDLSRPSKPKVKPALTGKLASELPGFVDAVFYMYKKTIEEDNEERVLRALLTKGTESIIAKDRSDLLPSVIVEPTMQMIYDYMTGSLVKEED